MISTSCGIIITTTNFTNADKVDFFIVATDRQKEILAEQFAKYTNHRPAIYTIPVGSLASLPQNENRTPFSMITASRLATEKHIELVSASSGSRQKKNCQNCLLISMEKVEKKASCVL